MFLQSFSKIKKPRTISDSEKQYVSERISMSHEMNFRYILVQTELTWSSEQLVRRLHTYSTLPEELRNEFGNCRCCSWSVRTPFAGGPWNSIDDRKLYWFWEAAKSNISCRTVCVRLYTYSMNTLDRAACLVHSTKQFGNWYWDKSIPLCDLKQPKKQFFRDRVQQSELRLLSQHTGWLLGVPDLCGAQQHLAWN